MPRKKKVPVSPPEPPRHRIRVGRDPRGKLQPAGYESGEESRCMDEAHRLTGLTIVEVGRPFSFHVPSAGQGPSGFVFEGMTGENARPWTPSQVLEAARHKMFGFRAVTE